MYNLSEVKKKKQPLTSKTWSKIAWSSPMSGSPFWGKYHFLFGFGKVEVQILLRL